MAGVRWMSDPDGQSILWASPEPSPLDQIVNVIGLGLWWSRIAVSDLLDTTAHQLEKLAAIIAQDEPVDVRLELPTTTVWRFMQKRMR